MKAFLKELKFESTKATYLRDITDNINKAIKKVAVRQGLVFVNTKHTTLGIVINEMAEPNLLEDILHHTLQSIPLLSAQMLTAPAGLMSLSGRA